MSKQTFAWDWNDQPDWPAIAAAVAEMSGGRVIIREVETTDDSYALEISTSAGDVGGGPS